MFNRARKMRTMEAAIIHYEDELLKKNRLLHNCGRTMEAVENVNKVLEECNDALSKENARMAANRDEDADLVQELWAEYRVMLRQHREVETLRDENYRLWVENAILRGTLARLDPKAAAEIAGVRT